jgi:hypothetical protein
MMAASRAIAGPRPTVVFGRPSQAPPAMRPMVTASSTGGGPVHHLSHTAIHARDRPIARQSPPPGTTAPTSSGSAGARLPALSIVQEPATGLEVKELLGKWRVLPTTQQPIKMIGIAVIACGAGPKAGQEIGIHQVMTSEVNNGRYRGATQADGSMWIRRDTPAVRPAMPCSDSPYSRFWNASKSAACGSSVTVEYSDFPKDMYDTVKTNPKTGKANFLSELHLDFQFTTALMHKRADGSLQTFRWLRWGVGWDYRFTTPPSGAAKVERGLASTSSITFTDNPARPPELPTRYAVPAKNCNTLTMEASDNPAATEASETW